MSKEKIICLGKEFCMMVCEKSMTRQRSTVDCRTQEYNRSFVWFCLHPSTQRSVEYFHFDTLRTKGAG